MTYYDPRLLDAHKHQKLLDWLEGEGLVANDISAEHFSVHEGEVSGYLLLRDEEGNLMRRHDETVKVHFRHNQINPLPEELL